MNRPRLPADHRALMQKVEEVVDHIERDPGDDFSIRSAAKQIIVKLRDELGIWGGRLYELDGDGYVLRSTFPNARDVDEEIRIPRTYPPLELCLMRGSIYMEKGDPLVDPELEASLGVEEFAAVEVGNEQYVLAFNVEPGENRDEVLYSLGVVRHSINQKLRQQQIADILSQARQIQSSILPRHAPRFFDFDIAGRTESLDSVGGDLYDFIPITDKILGLAIADASGHGFPAALQVRDVYTGLRMGLGRDFKIVRTVERLNQIIHQSTLTSRFVSLFYGELERNGAFIAVNAGHPAPFHLARDGEVSYLDQGGPVLGPLADASYDRSFAQLEPGDVLVLYTDGVTEALRDGVELEKGGEEYGTQRLLDVVRAHQRRRARAIVDAIFEDVERWAGAAPQYDDSTVVVVTYPE